MRVGSFGKLIEIYREWGMREIIIIMVVFV